MKQAIGRGAMSAGNTISLVLFHLLVLSVMGPGAQTDALFAGMTVPQLFAAVISASLTQVLVPLFAGEAVNEQRQDAWTLVALCSGFFAAATALLWLTSAWWVPVTVSGFDDSGKALTIELARISLLGMLFSGVNAVQWALAYSRHEYVWADAAPTLANLACIGLLVATLPTYGIHAAAWLSVLRLLLQSVLMLRVLGPVSAPAFARPNIRIAWARAKPLMFGASYYKIDPLVDRYLLSAAPSGSLSLLYLTQQIYSAGAQVVAKAFAVPAMTHMALAHGAGRTHEFKAQFRRAFVAMSTVCLVTIVGIALVGRPALGLAVGFGNFEHEDLMRLWELMMLASGLFLAGSLGTLSSGAFYSMGDTKTPTLLGSIAFTLGVVLKVVSFLAYGVYGVAAAISIYYLGSLALQLVVLRRRGLVGGET